MLLLPLISFLHRKPYSGRSEFPLIVYALYALTIAMMAVVSGAGFHVPLASRHFT